MTLEFEIVDVFADRPFAGNQLAVVLGADGLSDTQMRQIACEFGFSETAFVGEATDGDSDWSVRIWTPWEEVPIAGHPLVGTALVLARHGHSAERLSLGTAVGVVPVELDADGFAWMTQPGAEFGPVHSDPDALAAALSLGPEDLRGDLPTQVVSTGHEFLLAPIASLDAMRRMRARLDIWDSALEGFPAFIYGFSEQTEGEGVTAHCRLLAPHDIGSGEDAASGSAAGALACYLAQNARDYPDGDREFLFEQGIEMGRPSLLRAVVSADGRSRVGGKAAFVACGTLAAA